MYGQLSKFTKSHGFINLKQVNFTVCKLYIIQAIKKKKNSMNFPGSPVAKTPLPQCRGPGFNPLSGN